MKEQISNTRSIQTVEHSSALIQDNMEEPGRPMPTGMSQSQKMNTGFHMDATLESQIHRDRE